MKFLLMEFIQKFVFEIQSQNLKNYIKFKFNHLLCLFLAQTIRKTCVLRIV